MSGTPPPNVIILTLLPQTIGLEAVLSIVLGPTTLLSISKLKDQD